MEASVHDAERRTVKTSKTHGQHRGPDGEKTNWFLEKLWGSMEKGLPKAAGGKIPSELKVEAQCGVYRTCSYSCGFEVRRAREGARTTVHSCGVEVRR